MEPWGDNHDNDPGTLLQWDVGAVDCELRNVRLMTEPPLKGLVDVVLFISFEDMSLLEKKTSNREMRERCI